MDAVDLVVGGALREGDGVLSGVVEVEVFADAGGEEGVALVVGLSEGVSVFGAERDVSEECACFALRGGDFEGERE